MLSKEEIEEAKECLKETIQNTYAEGKAIKLNNLSEYIEQLETKEQKITDKLEEALKEYEHVLANEESAISLYAEIRKIVKGENDG